MTNVGKSSVAPIRCDGIDIGVILQNFPATLSEFPLKYLGLPLSLGRLRRVDLQPYIDKAASKLNPWKAKFLNRAGCAELVKSVLSSMPIFLLTAIKVDKSTIKAFDKIRRGMLWACSSSVSGGKCKVAWSKVCRPKNYGGLGILDLEKFARALRLRWLWFEWVSPDKSWVGLETHNDQLDRDLFNVATKVTIGNGLKASFWSSAWLNGFAPKSLAPLIFAVSKQKNNVSMTLCIITLGFGTSMFKISRLTILCNSSTSGSFSRELLLTLALRTQSLGLCRKMVATRRAPRTRLNSGDRCHAPSTGWFGKRGPLRSGVSLFGWFCRIGCGHQIALLSEDGRTALSAHFVCVSLKRLGTSSSSAVSPDAFGLRRSLGYPVLTSCKIWVLEDPLSCFCHGRCYQGVT